MTIETDMSRIEGLIDDFDRVPRAAFATYRTYPAKVRLEHTPRTSANCVYDHMVAEADRVFLGRAGIVAVELGGLKLWLIRDQAVIRWKKMDEDGIAANYPTPQAVEYDTGEDLPGLPQPAVRLTVGYVLDPTQQQIVRTQIARPFGKRRVEWCAAIVPAADGASGATWIDVTKQRKFG